MKFSVLTYNLEFGKVTSKLPKIISRYQPDIITFQEINTSPESLACMKRLGYSLADYANAFIKFNNIFGVATYYKKGSIRHIQSDSIDIPASMLEILTFIFRGGRRQRTILKTTFSIRRKKILIYNMHLTPYTTNKMRIKQIEEVLGSLRLGKYPIIALGDFNYTYWKRGLEDIFNKYNLSEATSRISHTFKSGIKIFTFNWKLDYIIYQNIKHISTQKINVRYSDHFPLIAVFDI